MVVGRRERLVEGGEREKGELRKEWKGWTLQGLDADSRGDLCACNRGGES